MSKYTPGQLGNFRGTTGQTVTSRWRGINVGRAAAEPSTKPPTVLQLAQRAEFALVIGFLSPISDIINMGYPNDNPKMTARNLAVSYHLKKAVTGIYPNLAIDYSKVQLSLGNLDSVVDPIATPVEGAIMTISWTAQDAPKISSKATDPVYLIFYSPAKDRYITFGGVSRRDALTYTAHLPKSFIGDAVHGWLYMASDDSKLVSKTEYLGLKTVLA